MHTTKLIYLAFLLFLPPSICFSQDKWSLEFRPAIDFPLQDIGDINSTTGFGFEVSGAFRLIPNLEVYAGWGWNQFKGEERSINSNETTFEEMGYTTGLVFTRPLESSQSISFVIRGGPVYEMIKTSNSSANFKSDYHFGWQISGGISYHFGGNWFLQPELRYRSLNTNEKVNSLSKEIRLDYISFGIGLGVAW